MQLSKIDAARRQLDCAIDLWFHDGDEVSIHTLACAAYQVVHDLKERRGIKGNLLYDAPFVEPKHRKTWNRRIRAAANFFKHADNDPEGILEFTTRHNIGFIVFAGAGLRLLGYRASLRLSALFFWLVIHKPTWIPAQHRQLVIDCVGVENLEEFKLIPKHDFLDHFLKAGNTAGLKPEAVLIG